MSRPASDPKRAALGGRNPPGAGALGRRDEPILGLVVRQREERRQRILEAARGLIAERGYDGVTLREVAQRGLVSVPTLYALFGSKNDLLYAAVASYFTDLVGMVEFVESHSGLARILSLVETLSTETPKHAAYSRSLVTFMRDASEPHGGLNDLMAGPLSHELHAALEQMQASRQLAAWADPWALAERLAGQLNIVIFGWALHQIGDDALRGTMLYGAAVTLLGLARGQAARDLEELVRKHQGATASDASRKPRAKRSGGS